MQHMIIQWKLFSLVLVNHSRTLKPRLIPLTASTHDKTNPKNIHNGSKLCVRSIMRTCGTNNLIFSPPLSRCSRLSESDFVSYSSTHANTTLSALMILVENSILIALFGEGNSSARTFSDFLIAS